MLGTLARYVTFPFRRPLLFETVLWLAFFALLKKCVSFKRLASVMGEQKAQTSSGLPPQQLDCAKQVRGAVRIAAARLPWARNCLTQALAAQAALKRRGIASTLYFGVSLGKGEDFKAHAWLRSGPEIITGEAGMGEFKVVSMFASEPSPTPTGKTAPPRPDRKEG